MDKLLDGCDGQAAFPRDVWPQARCTEDGFKVFNSFLPAVLVVSRREQQMIIFCCTSQLLLRPPVHAVVLCALRGGILPVAGLTSFFPGSFKREDVKMVKTSSAGFLSIF